ncbi:MAG: ribosome maturation factor RimP [Alphaproteobacteria bacterium]|nr:ribosome maturation factor RimP [Alphaproteobacteria bacterium]
MEIIQRIESTIMEPLSHRGYGVVRVQLTGNMQKTLQIMIENLDDTIVSVDNCAEVSGLVSALLDVGDFISGSYTLEVSSPGLERPLVKMKDYQRFVGENVIVKTQQPIDAYKDNRKTFQGKLASATETGITVLLDPLDNKETPSVDIDYHNIRSARLMIIF